MLNLSEQVKVMSIDEAIKIANNAKEEYKKDPQKVITALLKLQSLESLIGSSLKNVSDELVKILKKNNDTLDVSTDVKIKNADGQVEVNTLTVHIQPFDTVKTDVKFKELKEDNGLDIKMEDPNVSDPVLVDCQKINSQIVGYVVAANKSALSLFKTPAFAGNPTAFKAECALNTSLNKYQDTTTTTKYGLKVDLVTNNQ